MMIVGMVCICDDLCFVMMVVQKVIYDKIGNCLQVDVGFDEIVDGFDVGWLVLFLVKVKVKLLKYWNQWCEYDGIVFDS